MARKPNYRFDRIERERQKATKKAERLKIKQQKAEERKKAEEASSSPSSSLASD